MCYGNIQFALFAAFAYYLHVLKLVRLGSEEYIMMNINQEIQVQINIIDVWSDMDKIPMF